MALLFIVFSVIIPLMEAQNYGQYFYQNNAAYYNSYASASFPRTATYQQPQASYTSYNSFPPPYAGYYFGAYNRRDPFFYTQNYYPSYINNNYPDQYNFVGEPLPNGWTKLANGDIVTGNKLAAFYLICEGRSCQG